MTLFKQPKQKTSSAKTLLVIIGVVVLVIIIGSSLSNNDETKDAVEDRRETNTARAETQKDDGGSIGKTVEAWVVAMDFVKRQLVAPSTAKFIGVARSPYVQYLGNDRYLIKAAVDAQNSFGAMIRTEFRLVVRDERDSRSTWTLEEINI